MNKYSNFQHTKDGEQIFYQTNFPHGKKTENVLVFNYGLVCSNFHWSKQLDFFDSLGFDILIHDYRGHYQSSGKESLNKITFKQISYDLKEILDHLKIKSTIQIGHSMGVNVSLEFVRNFPQMVSKQILISGTVVPVHDIMMNTHLTGPAKAIFKDLRKKFPKEFSKIWKYGGWNPVVRKIIHTGGFNVNHVSSEFVEIYLNKMGQLGPDIFFQLIDQMHEHDSLTFINNIKAKTLVIGGNKDKVIPNFLQRLLHSKISQCELYILMDGSHVPQVDFAYYINERIEFFLKND